VLERKSTEYTVLKKAAGIQFSNFVIRPRTENRKGDCCCELKYGKAVVVEEDNIIVLE